MKKNKDQPAWNEFHDRHRRATRGPSQGTVYKFHQTSPIHHPKFTSEAILEVFLFPAERGHVLLDASVTAGEYAEDKNTSWKAPFARRCLTGDSFHPGRTSRLLETKKIL